MAGLDWCRALVRAAVILVLIAVVSGCVATRAPVVLTTAFDAQAASFINASGRAKVSGQAFVRLNSGKLWRATGTDVHLIPRTAHADERIAALYGNRNQLRWGVRMPDADPLYEQYMRKTVASSGGSFSFDHVADGEYYVVAMIHLPSEVSFIQFPILERVHVQGGKSVRLVMRGY
jgi:hypothetical protein